MKKRAAYWMRDLYRRSDENQTEDDERGKKEEEMNAHPTIQVNFQPSTWYYLLRPTNNGNRNIGKIIEAWVWCKEKYFCLSLFYFRSI